MKRYLLTFFLAAIIGIVGGLQGAAGSAYILAGLLFLDIIKTQRKAAGTTLLYTSIPITAAAAYEYHKTGDIDYKVALILIPTCIIFSYFGAILNKKISEKKVIISTGVVMLLCSIYYFIKAYNT